MASVALRGGRAQGLAVGTHVGGPALAEAGAFETGAAGPVAGAHQCGRPRRWCTRRAELVTARSVAVLPALVAGRAVPVATDLVPKTHALP